MILNAGFELWRCLTHLIKIWTRSNEVKTKGLGGVGVYVFI